MEGRVRTAIIGDVHGCLKELNELLGVLSLGHGDRVIFVGDLVHKGPDSEGVVRRVMALRDEVGELVLVKGNHEDKAVRQRLLDLTDDEWSFLGSAVYWYRGPGYVVAHGGIPTELLELPADPRGIEGLSNSKRKYFDRLLRTRYIDTEGKFVALADRTATDILWAKKYDGRFGVCYFGHEPFFGEHPEVFHCAIGTDLGCVFGRRLCAVFVEDDGRMSRYVTVQAEQRYCEPRDIESDYGG